MLYLEAPNALPPELRLKPSIFLAGGISGCPDWQRPYAKVLLDHTDLVVINPRRSEDVLSTDLEAIQQITWEHSYLSQADIISFWFPKETLCPITLFELGYWLAHCKLTKPKIFIGAHPSYQRFLDVQVQTHLVDPTIKIHESLDDLAADVIQYYEQRITSLLQWATLS